MPNTNPEDITVGTRVAFETLAGLQNYNHATVFAAVTILIAALPLEADRALYHINAAAEDEQQNA